MTFIDEILAEAEADAQERRQEMSRIRADQMLMVLQRLDAQSQGIAETAESEVKLIEEWRNAEESRIEKKRSWLVWNLEQFIKASGEKTIRLPHGSIKLRQGRDKVEIIDIDQFMAVGPRKGLVRTYPEHQEPDLPAILAHVKRTGEIPQGVQIALATTKFIYQLKGSDDGAERKAEA